MDTTTPRRRPLRRLVGPWIAIAFIASLGAGAAGCSGGDMDGTGGDGSHAAMTDPAAQMAWANRPAFVRNADGRTQEAYRYALERPDVVKWMPCYCGCVGLDHRSNLDCFVQPRTQGSPIALEEHGAYCGVCVDTALMAKQMLSEGKTLLQIRLAVDREFGSLAPGTLTDLPPG